MTLDGLREELADMKHSNQAAGPASSSDKSSVGSPQPSIKSSSKVKNLEQLLAKCKESLKLKNSQIQTLKDSLGEVENFREFNESLKRELAELREAHETWTVSIAESKRVLHQEIEVKNAEIEAAKLEANELQLKLNDSHNQAKQLRSTIQDLQSRLVNTSAAHQKERENLKKELTAAKNTALKQLQKEHDHNIERVKLDLEKTIGALRQDLLKKDEQIVKDTESFQQLQSRNNSLASDIEGCNKALNETLKRLEESERGRESDLKLLNDLRAEIEGVKSAKDATLSESEARINELVEQVRSLQEQLSSAEDNKCQLEARFETMESNKGECQKCQQLQENIRRNAESYEQSLYELNTRLDLMTTANIDQEKEIRAIKSERDTMNESYKILKTDFEELAKKNEILSRTLKESEAELQSSQEQLDQLSTTKQELENLKRENTNLNTTLKQLKFELSERSSDLIQFRTENLELKDELNKLKTQFKESLKSNEELKREKESLVQSQKSHNQRRRELDAQLVVRILAAMKNLETPTTSPGSDKTYESDQNNSYASDEATNSANLPDLLNLSEQLSSIALDRSNAYATATHRLQAVLLENNMMGDELRRLKEEINNLNTEKTLETQCSMDESERLRTENQALIHDQKSYDDRIGSLEAEIQVLNAKLSEKVENESSDHTYQIRALQRVLQQCQEENQRLKETLSSQIQKNPENAVVPDSTQFEYLKNIIYQFMLGKEPLVLTKVISAILNFDKSQVEQVYKIQEAITALRQIN